jgi:cell shape-determining protein MreC
VENRFGAVHRGQGILATRECGLEVAAVEQILGFLALLVTALGLVSVAAWFFCSLVLSLAKTKRELDDAPRYNTLLDENERLRSMLAEAEGDNARLRELLGYSPRLRRQSGVLRDAA